MVVQQESVTVDPSDPVIPNNNYVPPTERNHNSKSFVPTTPPATELPAMFFSAVGETQGLEFRELFRKQQVSITQEHFMNDDLINVQSLNSFLYVPLDDGI